MSFACKEDFPFDSIFDGLPVELQLEILSYISNQEHYKMRLVSSRWDMELSCLTSLQYHTCILNDSTFNFVLSSSKDVRSLVVEGLVENVLDFGSTSGTAAPCSNRYHLRSHGSEPQPPPPLPTEEGVVEDRGRLIRTVSQIVFGQRVHSQNVREILKRAESIEVLGINNFDISVSKTILEFPQFFETVTRLQLKLNVLEGVSKDEQAFLEVLCADTGKFPNVQHFDVDWGMTNNREIFTLQESRRLHGIYVSLHEFLYNHRQTLQTICWNFSSLTVLPCLIDDEWRSNETHSNLQKKLEQVALKEVVLRICEMEGDYFWDLSEMMLLNQHSLTNLQYFGSDVITGYPFIGDVLRNNADFLEELHIGITSLPGIVCCHRLRKLYITISRNNKEIPTVPLISHNSLKEVTIDCQDSSDTSSVSSIISWLADIESIRVVNLMVELKWVQPTYLPSDEELVNLLKSPRINQLNLTYKKLNCASKLSVISRKSKTFSQMCAKPDFIRGSRIKIKEHFAEKKGAYEINFSVQRYGCLDIALQPQVSKCVKISTKS